MPSRRRAWPASASAIELGEPVPSALWLTLSTRPLSPGRFEATEHTAGPWDPAHQHGGPPAALLARAIESTRPRPQHQIARIALDILGPIPLGELEVAAHLVRPGRSVELLEAELTAHGRPVMQATAWRVLIAPPDVPVDASDPAPRIGPTDSPARELDLPEQWRSGYLQAIEWRLIEGNLLQPGPSAAWTRMRLPLVDDEPVSPVQRALVVADSGSGLSNVLDIRSWLFINPDLTVHFTRPPRGEWIQLDAVTTVAPGTVGLARSTLSDVDGPVGFGTQSLLIAHRAVPR